MHPHPIRLVTFFSAIIVTSCLVETSSTINHAPRTPAGPYSRGLWVVQSPEMARQRQSNSGVEIAHPTSELSNFITNWATALHTSYSNHTGVDWLPPPVALVIANAAPNAAATAESVCFSILVTVEGPSPQAVDGVTLRIRDNSTRPHSTPNCIEGSEVGLKLVDVVAAYQAKSNGVDSACQLTLHENHLLLAGNCQQTNGLTAPRIEFRMATNVVLLNSGLIATFAEDEVVAALAHELGHIYRAHQSLPAHRLGYDFIHNPHANLPEFPKPTNDAEALQLAHSLRTQPPLAPQPDQLRRFHFQVLRALATHRDGMDRELGRSCTTSTCESACQPLFETARDRSLMRALRISDFDSIDAEDFQRLEADLAKCAQAFQLGKDIPAEYALETLWPPWADLLANEHTAANPNTLLDSLDFLSQLFFAIEINQHNQLKRASEIGLGWYSIEQEADDVAAELLALVNVKPQSMQDLFFRLLKDATMTPGDDSIDYKTCREWEENNWKDRAGQLRFVPIGRWNDIHHSHCYRIFNVARELAGHNYEVDNSRRAVAHENWSDFQRQAERMHRQDGPRRH